MTLRTSNNLNIQTNYFLAVWDGQVWTIGDDPMPAGAAHEAAQTFADQENMTTAVVEQLTRRVRVCQPSGVDPKRYA